MRKIGLISISIVVLASASLALVCVARWLRWLTVTESFYSEFATATYSNAHNNITDFQIGCVWHFDANKYRELSRLRSTLVHVTETRASMTNILEAMGKPARLPYGGWHEMAYRLGDERGLFGIDSEWLVFQFDDEGVVSNVLVRSD